MAIKEIKTETCQKVQLRRYAVRGRSHASLVVSSPQPQTLANLRSVDGVPSVTNQPISPMSPTEESDGSSNTSKHDHESTDINYTIDYQGLSIDWILNSPLSEVYKLLRQLDLRTDGHLVNEMMLHYSLIINGLPDCPEEDLPLAIYFFIEDTFSIQSKLVKCVKIRQYDERMDVAVLFDSIRMKYDILKKDELLEGTEVRIVNNDNLAWFRTHV